MQESYAPTTARSAERDVLRLAGWGERFDVVLDSLVFHGIHDGQRLRYVESLGAVLEPGGRLFVLCLAEKPPRRGGPVHSLTPGEIERAFADGWRIDAIDPVTIASALPALPTLPALPDGLRGWRTYPTRTTTTEEHV